MSTITAPLSTIIRRKQLEPKTGLSRSSIYARLDHKSPQYDPTFPRPISLGLRAVGWLSHEVDDWLANRPRHFPHAIETESLE